MVDGGNTADDFSLLDWRQPSCGGGANIGWHQILRFSSSECPWISVAVQQQILTRNVSGTGRTKECTDLSEFVRRAEAPGGYLMEQNL
jgi:hypothetical protein